MRNSKRYKSVKFTTIPNFLYVLIFIHCKKPFVWIYTKIKGYNYAFYIERLYLIDTLRRQVFYAEEQSTLKRKTIELYYRFTDTTLKVRFRITKYLNENDYVKFRYNVQINTGLEIVSNYQKKGFSCFDLMISFEPEKVHIADKEKVTVGTGLNGLECWNYAEYPHMLCTGPTQNGKSVFLRGLLTAFLKAQFQIHLLDGKSMDYANYKHLFYRYEENEAENKKNCIRLIHEFYDSMQERKNYMKTKGISNYTQDDTLQPVFLVIDELLLFVGGLEKKKRNW